MTDNIALLGIIVENSDNIRELNAILHDYGGYIVGRMGIPYEKRGVSVISIVLDASQKVIDSLFERIENLSGITANIVYTKNERCVKG